MLATKKNLSQTSFGLFHDAAAPCWPGRNKNDLNFDEGGVRSVIPVSGYPFEAPNRVRYLKDIGNSQSLPVRNRGLYDIDITLIGSGFQSYCIDKDINEMHAIETSLLD
jgi:hypothetical protein